MLLAKYECTNENYKIDIIDEALLVNKYNLIWNKKIVLGGYRNWRKKKRIRLGNNFEVYQIDNDLCKRCNKNEKETWDHIWICEGNEVMIDEVAQEAIYRFKKILETNDQQDEIKISILIS
ncbi:hypothetical protein RhiirA4_450708 [Rhizophagus irregularis]|uniref:Uncharacterized protein n=1 Tax=Rhizophagus irregularis TaxID=588596 RepID=A0A2I1FTV6_9GLOM|nr:hypothetical protein RhiirA4_450708 [Rhizophagus irregularis]